MLSKRGTIFSAMFVIMLLFISTAPAFAQSSVIYLPLMQGNEEASNQENMAQEEEPVQEQAVSPDAHLPVRIIRFSNIGNDANFNTGVPANLWYCVATSWSGQWDILENNTNNNYVWTQVNTTLNTWFIRGSFASHGNHESLDVDVLCFRNNLAHWEGASPTLFDPD